MPKTILYYTDCKYFGGAEEYLLTIFKKIDRSLWHPVLLYHPRVENSAFADSVKDLMVETVSTPEIRGFTDINSIYKLIRNIKSLKPSVFHANINWPLSCSYGIVCAAMSGVKITVATQHLFLDSIGRKKTIIQKVISRFVDRYITVSKRISENMKTTISQTLNTEVIHNGIVLDDPNVREKDNFRAGIIEELSDKNNRPIILTVARLHKQKGHTYLLQASKQIPNAIFVLAGDGPERNHLENYSKELNVEDRVLFLGHRDDIPNLINECDIFVLPSLFEGLPLTILEAMAVAKPVIASDIPGVDEEVINNKTGLLVPPENADALAEAISYLLSNSDFAQELGRGGEKRVYKEFSAEKMVNSITDLYKELLNIAR